MAKIPTYSENTSPADDDVLISVDISDTTDDATGSSKRVQVSKLRDVVEDTTPQLGGALDVNAKEITGAIDLHSTGDIILELGDNLGANVVSVRDDTGTENALVKSNGVAQFANIELGHATDTTISRTGAGVVTIEGVEITTNSGTQTLTNKTLTNPIIGQIVDTNSASAILVDTTSSAVNFLRVTPNSTGGDVTVTGTGSDAAVSLDLVTKGAGTVKVNGSDAMALGIDSQVVTGTKIFADGTFLLRNVAGTFDSEFNNTNTAARVYTLQDATGTIAFTSDITGTNSGTNTGDEVAANTTTAGVAEIATTAEVDAGTDDTRTISPLALAGSAPAILGTNVTAIPVANMAALTASELMVTDGSGKATTSAGVSATEASYLNGVTSAIQTQIDAKEAIQRYKDFSIPAGAWAPYTTGGAVAAATVYGSNEVDMMQFSTAAEDAVYIQFRLPEDYLDGSVLRWAVDWDALATASGTAIWGLSGGVFDNSLALSTALGTERTITDTLLTVGDLHKSPNDATGITLAGTPVAGDFCILKLVVKTTSTIAVDVLGANLQIQYRTATTTPAVWA